jgi:hypothetical protein
MTGRVWFRIFTPNNTRKWIIKIIKSKVKSDGFKQNRESQKADDGCAY